MIGNKNEKLNPQTIMRRLLIIMAVAHRYNHIQIVEINGSCNRSIALLTNYSNFLSSCRWFQFLSMRFKCVETRLDFIFTRCLLNYAANACIASVSTRLLACTFDQFDEYHLQYVRVEPALGGVCHMHIEKASPY